MDYSLHFVHKTKYHIGTSSPLHLMVPTPTTLEGPSLFIHTHYAFTSLWVWLSAPGRSWLILILPLPAASGSSQSPCCSSVPLNKALAPWFLGPRGSSDSCLGSWRLVQERPNLTALGKTLVYFLIYLYSTVCGVGVESLWGFHLLFVIPRKPQDRFIYDDLWVERVIH